MMTEKSAGINVAFEFEWGFSGTTMSEPMADEEIFSCDIWRLLRIRLVNMSGCIDMRLRLKSAERQQIPLE